MAAPRFNIGAAYDLAESATAALKGHYDEIYFEDHIDVFQSGFWEAAVAPNKRTLLHRFLQSWENFRWDEAFAHGLEEDFAHISDYLRRCDVVLPTWFTEKSLSKREARVWRLIESATPKATNAAFNLLFQDRSFLVLFHQSIHEAMKKSLEARTTKAILPVPRCAYIPEWLKKGVYHRDRGICQNCGRDVSGLLNLEGVIHLDHLLPLAAGGTNDPTNFQLLCRECNLSKGGREIDAQGINHSFW